jgi:hypothetical protein
MLCRSSSRNFFIGSLIFILSSAALLVPALARAQSIPQMNGVFGANLSNSQTASALANSNVDGLQVTEPWNVVEAQEGVFDWSSIDSVVAAAATAGKKISLGIQAGYVTPAWVYTDGAKAFPFVWDKVTDSPTICSIQNLPVPWDPVFLSKWQALVAAFGAHYAANPTIVSVILYGANTATVETILPYTIGEVITDGTTSCTGPNYPAKWQAAGYTRTVLENALYQMQGFFVQAFPRTLLLAALSPGSFPPIDQNGNLLAATTDFQVPLDLLNYGMNKLGRQYSAGNGGLNNIWVWSLLAGYGSALNVGFQAAAPLGPGLTAAGNLAIGANASWIELYGPDLEDVALQPEIALLHQSLLP